MSDVFWQALIGGFFTAMPIIVLGYWKLRTIEKTGKDTHTLVNNAMGVQLLMNSDLAEFKAATTKLPEDLAAAKIAKMRLREHMKKQAEVDAKNARKERGEREYLPISIEEAKTEIIDAVDAVPDKVVEQLPPKLKK